MGILSDFEDRVASGIEGFFAGAFRSPVQPVEIAKALARSADDARVVGANVVYAPNRFTVALSPEDSRKLGSFKTVLAGELATYLMDHAREQHYHLIARPVVTFVTHDDLTLGRFRVSAELAEAPVEQDPHSATTDTATLTFANSGRHIPLDTYEVVIGRLPTCTICIDDANVSRRHAAIVRLDDGWAVTDLDSTNGTRVNGTEVTRARLHDGDVIEVGLTRLIFHEAGR